jgi:hypothetical protein
MDYAIGDLFQQLFKMDEARAAYQRDMDEHPHNREAALGSICLSYINGPFERKKALACTQQLVTEFPSNVRSWYARSVVLELARDPHAKAAVAKFRKMMDPTNPDQADMDSEITRASQNPRSDEATSGTDDAAPDSSNPAASH